MSVRNQLKLLVGGLSSRRGEAATSPGSGFREFLDQSRLVAGLIFVVTVAAIVIVSSAGMRVLDLPVLPSQVAPVRIVAGFPFSYVSPTRTQAQREQSLLRLPPIYRLDTGPLERFEVSARDLLGKLASFEAAHPSPSAMFYDRRKALGRSPTTSTRRAHSRRTRTTWPRSSRPATPRRAPGSSRTGSPRCARSTARASTRPRPPAPRPTPS